VVAAGATAAGLLDGGYPPGAAACAAAAESTAAAAASSAKITAEGAHAPLVARCGKGRAKAAGYQRKGWHTKKVPSFYHNWPEMAIRIKYILLRIFWPQTPRKKRGGKIPKAKHQGLI
jgi:hypothetical protein